jgi:hypothetical protein
MPNKRRSNGGSLIIILDLKNTILYNTFHFLVSRNLGTISLYSFPVNKIKIHGLKIKFEFDTGLWFNGSCVRKTITRGIVMIIGNMVLNSYKSVKHSCRESSGLICKYCLEECEKVPIDESFSDAFGHVECWSQASNCCGADVYDGRLFLNKVSYHTAKKDHNDQIKKGMRYKAVIQKGYYIDGGKHEGIYFYRKYPCN